MAISRVGAVANQVTDSTTSPSVVSTIPSGIAAGDFCILAISQNRDTTVVTPPTGWTFLRRVQDTATTKFDIYTRVSDGSGITATTTFSQPTAVAAALISHVVAYRGVDTTNPFIAENGVNETGTTATHSAPALTNTDAGAWGVFNAMTRGLATPTSWTAGTGLTKQLDTDGGLSTGNNAVAITADSDSTVATGTVTYSGTNPATSATAVMWAGLLRPASGAATQTLTPPALASMATAPAPTVTPGPVTLAPPLLASAPTQFAPSISGTTPATTLSPPRLSSAAAQFAPAVAGVQTPGQVLNIGTGAGQNQFEVQIAPNGGSAIEVHSLQEIIAGYSDPLHFRTTSDGWVRFSPRADGPTTSGSTFARDEMREVNPDGSALKFDALAGESTLTTQFRINHVPANDPDVVVAQLHDGDQDRIAVRTQMFSNGTTVLGVRFNGTLHATRLQSTFVPGTECVVKIRVYNQGAIQVFYNDMVTPLISMPTGTLVQTVDPNGWYWKWGAYNQFNPTATGATGLTVPANEYSEVDHKAPTVTHTATGNATLSPPLLSSTPAQLAPAVALGAVTLAPPLQTSTAAQLAPTVTVGAVTLAPPLQASTPAQLAPTVSYGPVSLALPLQASSAALSVPGIVQGQPGAVSLVPPTLSSAPAQPAPTVSVGQAPATTLSPPLLSSTPTVLAPTLALGPATLAPPLQSRLPAQLDPIILLGPVTLAPPVQASSPTVLAPAVQIIVQTVRPPLLAGTRAALAPAVKVNVTLKPPKLAGPRLLLVPSFGGPSGPGVPALFAWNGTAWVPTTLKVS